METCYRYSEPEYDLVMLLGTDEYTGLEGSTRETVNMLLPVLRLKRVLLVMF